LAGISAGGLALIALCAAWLGQDVRPPHEAPLSTRPAKSTPALEASAVPPVRQSAAPLALTGPSYSPSDRSANTAPATTQSPAEDDRSAALVKSAQATAENTQRIAEAAQNAVDNTHQIAEVARQTAENTAQIAEATRTISTSIEALREAWTRTADRGGLVENPDRPSDYYHNARLLEQRGDHLGARRQYARFLAYQLNAVDPHLRFQRLLRIQDGAAAARETYAGMLELQSDLAT
jgi:hypothetical protein